MMGQACAGQVMLFQSNLFVAYKGLFLCNAALMLLQQLFLERNCGDLEGFGGSIVKPPNGQHVCYSPNARIYTICCNAVLLSRWSEWQKQ